MKRTSLRYLLLRVCLVPILGLAVSGCFSIKNTDSATIEPDHQPSTTPLPASLTPTITATIVPTFTLTATQTLIPTSEAASSENMIQSLSSQCRLSCWGNIIPGKTSEFATKKFLSSIGELINGSVFFEYRNKRVVVDLTYKDGLVTSINLPPGITELYSVHYLFNEYGEPEEVGAEVIPETAEGTSWFSLILVYPQQGFFAIYSGEATFSQSFINICPTDTSPDLYLLESSRYTLAEMNIFVTRGWHKLKPLDALTEMDAHEFYESFRTTDNQCLLTTVPVP
ncbi:MAG: hypothetical protein H7Y59_13550 [Anaerolineales bacterium]|nr:hypothetical protein [Anaerolineales bacterium]